MDNESRSEAVKAADYKLLKLSSTAINEDGTIGKNYTCEGEDINPSFGIESLPTETKTLVIIVTASEGLDEDFCHWVIWNIPLTHHIKEKEKRGVTGLNSYGLLKYKGPCPRQPGLHHYDFKIYALDTVLDLPKKSLKKDVEKAMSDHIIAFGLLSGKYQKQ